jgi:hypothetical protein
LPILPIIRVSKLLTVMLLSSCAVDSKQFQGVSPEVLKKHEQALSLSANLGCLSCHSLDGSPGIGPSWAGLWGESVLLADSSEVIADEAYLRRAILQPEFELVAGYQGLMLAPKITDDQLNELIKLLEALQ